jgi:hypothetical protein
MSGPQKRTPPVETGRAVKELRMGSTQGYQRRTDETRQSAPSRPTAERPIHWARRGDRSVITCQCGEAHVILINNHDRGWRVVVRRKSAVVSFARRYSTESEGKATAERVSREIGLDGPGFPGLWRSDPATSPQVNTLKRMRIQFCSEITKGEAGDEIALSIAESVDLDRVITNRPSRS